MPGDALRHALATVAYRGAKAIRGAAPGFAHFRASPDIRTPAEILAHLGDLFEWALSMANGCEKWRNSTPLSWELESARFFAALEAFDSRLASDEPPAVPAGTLFQGPVADALAHIGQLAMLRRLSGSPIRGENYARADIAAGRTGERQTAPRREFD